MDLAQNLTQSANCGSELSGGNTVVVEAYDAMIAYETLYQASCLKDPQTSAYCFADAVTNQSTVSDVYLYFLPLNTSFPGSSQPSCNWCDQQTMAIFRSAAANRNLPIAQTYVAAANMVDTFCGPNFANTTLPEAVVESAAFSALATGSSSILVMGVAFAVGLLWLL